MQLAQDHEANRSEQSSSADLSGFLFLTTTLVLRGFVGSMLCFLNLSHRQRHAHAGWLDSNPCIWGTLFPLLVPADGMEMYLGKRTVGLGQMAS